jgi:hypothetical protein
MENITALQEHCKSILNVATSQSILDAFALAWCQNNSDIRLYTEEDEGQFFNGCVPMSDSVIAINVTYWDYNKTDPGHFEWTNTYLVDIITGLEVEQELGDEQ